MATLENAELGKGGKYEAIVSTENIPVVSWKNLNVYTSDSYQQIFKNGVSNLTGSGAVGGKAILNDLSGQINGGFWGLMGPSGSGKTTLLNALALRLDPLRMAKTGITAIDGRPYRKRYLKKISGYVMQDDVLAVEYTIQETLYYAAVLKLDLTKEERDRRIDEAINLLGISHRRDVIVGDSRRKGISGGERKRLCIAIELLAKPKLLFLDEPTSGLDSSSALALIQALRQVADRRESTIIASIHQPPSKVFALIENVILMRLGSIVYSGLTKDATSYFASLGFTPIADRVNPSDYLLDAISKSAEGGIVPPPFIQEVDVTAGSEKPLYTPPPQALQVEVFVAVKKWTHQFFTLFIRYLIQHWRRFLPFFLNIWVGIIVAFIATGSTWLYIGNDQTVGPGKRPGILFFCIVHQGLVYSLQGAHNFPLERAVMLRERHAGTYHVSAYFLGKVLSDMVTQIPASIFFSLIMWKRVGLNSGPGKLAIFLWVNLLACNAATATASMLSAIFVSVQTTVIVLGICWEISRLFGGWFISPALFKSGHYFSWKILDKTSYIQYGFTALMINEYNGLKLICWPSQLKSKVVNGQTVKYCPITDASTLLPQWGYQESTVWECCWALIGLILGFRLISYIALKFIKI